MSMQSAPLAAPNQPNIRRAALLGSASVSVLTLSLAVATAPAVAQPWQVPSSNPGLVTIPSGQTGVMNGG